jgi:hypothetical protein
MLRLPNANPAQGWRAIILLGTAVLALCATACTQPAQQGSVDENPPQQAGQPLNAVAVAGHIASIRVAALTGNRQAVQANAKAFSDDFRRSIKLPDPARPIDHEAARAAVRPLAGVRSSVWMDRSNLIVMVDGAQYRSAAMINRVCNALAPLGDTLAVVVNIQNVNAKTSQEADTLSRNCQLPEGQRAFLQPKRQIDALDPATRRAFEAQQSGAARK